MYRIVKRIHFWKMYIVQSVRQWLMSRHYPSVFYLDGSYRDIYIRDTTLEDWQKVLNFLHASSYYSTTFSIDQQENSSIPSKIEGIVPTKVEDVMALFPATAYLAIGPLGVNCHFFEVEDMEFDISPRGTIDHHIEYQVIEFMRALGTLLQKVVTLTPENRHDDVLYSFDPRTKKERCTKSSS